MADIPHKKTLQELKREAFAELERRGYDVRGKTPAKIRQMLKARPPSVGHAICDKRNKPDPRARVNNGDNPDSFTN